MTEHRYPKRLIEVDLPIKRISAHARREKSIRHGHISTLHIWWARRPLAACRAVICASLWPDPADPLCPPVFRDDAFRILNEFKSDVTAGKSSPDRTAAETAIRAIHFPTNKGQHLELRRCLLDFIAEFANWDLSTNQHFLETSRALTQAAHVALGGTSGTRPLVVDPFAGGGSIPLEALRVGADAFASDLNPIPVLLNKVVLEYIPKYGQRLADEVRKWGAWVKDEAEKELADLYPHDSAGAVPIAYLWARTIRCEGPGCGADIPLIRTNVLFSKGKHQWFLHPILDNQNGTLEFRIGSNELNFSTVKSGTLICPFCKFTTPNKRVMAQVISKRGGANSASLLAIVVESEKGGRKYVRGEGCVFPRDLVGTRLCLLEQSGELSPSVHINHIRPSPNARGLSAVTRYGMSEFRDLHSKRQIVTLLTIRRLVRTASQHAQSDISEALASCLTLAFGRLIDRNSTLCRWIPQTGAVGYTFGRQALSMIWDFVEVNPLRHSGGWSGAFEDLAFAIETNNMSLLGSQAELCSATEHALPDDIAQAVITDPPYYDAIPYADLSDFFYVWLQPLIKSIHPTLASGETTPKEQEAIWNPGRRLANGGIKDETFYENQMRLALTEARRVTSPQGVGVVVFAHKSTAGWEALLNGMVQAGWMVQASWPIDTEREARTNAIGTASLASSIHLVCRPRETPDGALLTDDIGDWREVLQELPRRIHEWMPRLAAEGVVGADAIFACLGPALEIFSRYSRVEKASGEVVKLKEYLEQVWAAVAREALSTVLNDADANALDPDARLTVIWLWTLGGGQEESSAGQADDEDAEEDDESPSAKSAGGFTLEYDAARKIAQGLGARLEELHQVVEVKADKARLLPVSERSRYLFAKTETLMAQPKKAPKKPQMSLFAEIEEAEAARSWDEVGPPRSATTTLDRVHQAMLLFGAGRSEAMKRFLVDEGVGRNTAFWKLSQSLSALYPAGSEEKRWVDGVLARKKGLGFG